MGLTIQKAIDNARSVHASTQETLPNKTSSNSLIRRLASIFEKIRNLFFSKKDVSDLNGRVSHNVEDGGPRFGPKIPSKIKQHSPEELSIKLAQDRDLVNKDNIIARLKILIKLLENEVDNKLSKGDISIRNSLIEKYTPPASELEKTSTGEHLSVPYIKYYKKQLALLSDLTISQKDMNHFLLGEVKKINSNKLSVEKFGDRYLTYCEPPPRFET